MTWFKVDDSFYRSRKVRKLGTHRVAAVGLWTLCGGWAADNLTDGFVPWEVVEGWDPGRDIAKHLLAATLWEDAEVDGEEGVQFHDWDDWQPTKAQVSQRRKADAERRARWRETRKVRESAAAGTSQPASGSHRDAPAASNVSHRDAHRDSQGDATVHPIRDSARDATVHPSDQGTLDVNPDMSRSASRRDTPRESRVGSALPDPTRPDPTRPEQEELLRADSVDEKPARRKRPAHALPDTWRPNESHELFAAENGIDLAHETRQFRNHAEANDRRQVSWDAAFRQWLGNATRYSSSRPSFRPAVGGPDRVSTTTARVQTALSYLRPEED